MADIISLPRIASWASIGTTLDTTAVDDALTKAKLNYEVTKELPLSCKRGQNP
jgi:hypothetical protein